MHEGDIWSFPKGQAHTFQGLSDQNEYLLAFDQPDFDAVGTTFAVDDWITHTPRSILAKNFGMLSIHGGSFRLLKQEPADDCLSSIGVNESVFDTVPSPDPYIQNGNLSNSTVESPYGKLDGNASYAYPLSQQKPVEVPGGGGTISIVDSRNFPASSTIAAAIVVLKPGALRELHWHPTVSVLSAALESSLPLSL